MTRRCVVQIQAWTCMSTLFTDTTLGWRITRFVPVDRKHICRVERTGVWSVVVQKFWRLHTRCVVSQLRSCPSYLTMVKNYESVFSGIWWRSRNVAVKCVAPVRSSFNQPTYIVCQHTTVVGMHFTDDRLVVGSVPVIGKWAELCGDPPNIFRCVE